MAPAAVCCPGDVVVTGLGTINPLGGDAASTWAALHAGTCAIRALEPSWVDDYELPVRIGAPLAIDPAEMLSPRQMRRLDRASQCALLAARQAWEQAGPPQVAPQRLAVSVSPGMGPVLSVMEAWDALRVKGPRRVLPTAVPALMPNAPAAAYGADLIALGRADVVVAGGTDAALHPMTVAAFGAMRALSTRNDDPATASRPFAPDRDGFVLGEGAGILVLERAEHAMARRARVLAVLAGSGITADAHDVARPEPSGAEQERALLLALERAGLDAGAIGHVNAHATSTPAGDVVEAGVLARAVPEASVSATKSSTGHLLGGAGGLEAVLTVMALRERWAPPTLLPAGVDPELAGLGLDVVGPQGRDLPELEAAASTSFGFGGHNVALVFTRDRATTAERRRL